MTISRRRLILSTAALMVACVPNFALAQDSAPSELRIDFATYNPLSLLIKQKGWLEEDFAPDATTITWVQSAGSNKALEFLNANAIDIGSTAGSAALLAKINGNPIKSVYSYSRPEWTALLTRGDSDIKSVADLKGKSVAVTRGTDPHIFLIRALAEAGLTEADITPVLLQHADGRAALVRGDVDAWAALDPIFAAAELQDGAVILHRNLDANTYGILNVREDFLNTHPQTVSRVLAVYEKARKYALENPAELQAITQEVTGLPAEVIARQLNERTDLSQPRLGSAQRDAILAAGLALQSAGVIEANVDVTGTVDALLDDRLP